MATPLVAFKASQLLRRFPTASANLLRALLVGGATVPQPAAELLERVSKDTVRHVCGNGLVELERAAYSDDNRVVLYAEDELPFDHFAVYEVPVPKEYQSEKGRREIRGQGLLRGLPRPQRVTPGSASSPRFQVDSHLVSLLDRSAPRRRSQVLDGAAKTTRTPAEARRFGSDIELTFYLPSVSGRELGSERSLGENVPGKQLPLPLLVDPVAVIL